MVSFRFESNVKHLTWKDYVFENLQHDQINQSTVKHNIIHLPLVSISENFRKLISFKNKVLLITPIENFFQ